MPNYVIGKQHSSMRMGINLHAVVSMPVLSPLHIICQSLIVSRILYARPASGGLLSTELKGQINAFLWRLYKYGFTHSIIDIEHLLTSGDRKLFRNMQKCEHCLGHLQPSTQRWIMILNFDLRPFCCLFV